MSTTTTNTETSITTIAPAVFPTVLNLPRASLSNRAETPATNAIPANNPQNWPTGFRNVPNYRPANPDLDQSERPYGGNRIEWVIGHLLMQGVMIQSGFTKAWEATGYRWWPGLTQFEIGGEW